MRKYRKKVQGSLSNLFSPAHNYAHYVQVSADSMEMPDLPANYVMDEFVKAREKARMPKKGSVKSAAGVWYEEHHD